MQNSHHQKYHKYDTRTIHISRNHGYDPYFSTLLSKLIELLEPKNSKFSFKQTIKKKNIKKL